MVFRLGRHLHILTLLCLSMLLADGCSKVTTSTGGAPGNAATIHGVVRVALKAEPNTLNPVISGLIQEGYVESAIFDGLVQYDDHAKLVPDLATEVPSLANGGISSDGKTITYHLRDNVVWHDGQPLRSDDVAFTYRLYVNPKVNGYYQQTYARIAALTTPDPHTVVLHLRAPFASALYQFFERGNGGFVVPRHILERSSDINRDPFSQHPVGTGPMRFDRWDHGTLIVLQANPHYFAGAPKIRSVHILIVANPNTTRSMVASHELDVATDLTPTQYSGLQHLDGVHAFLVPTYLERFLTFNVRREPFTDPRVRQALAFALDRRRIVATAYNNTAIAADSLIPPYDWAYDKDNAAPRYDPAAAKALLQSAGWTLGAENTWHKQGRTLAFGLLNQPELNSLSTLGQEIQRAWRELGVDVTIRQVPRNIIYGNPGLAFSGRFDTLIDDWGADTEPDRTHIIATKEISPRGFNDAFFSDALIDRWSEEALASYDQAKRARLYAQIQRRLNTELPYVPLVWEQRIYALNTDLHGFKAEPIYSDFWNVQEWQI
ncbi:MAG: peptide ABC transporter substrate-binding protein [Candidatus Eremiobacteraeota bacterium]|nr:peptide ABC transporter substrate-binding protein [Candidatus Eremiobacteraeota bacterium]